MRRPVAESLHRLLFASLLAVLLPAAGLAEGELPSTSADGAACRVPAASDETLPAAAPVDLGASWARLAAEAPRAEAEGYRPLNTRGYNYAADSRGLEQASLEFEAGRQGAGAP